MKRRSEICGGGASVLLRLRTVIDNSLSQFTESELVSLTLDKERTVLVSLSQVLNEIRRLTLEYEVDEQCSGSSNSHSKDHECLTNIVANLVLFLDLKSQYVQHLVTNIFVVISEFLLSYGRIWDYLIQLLCIYFERTLGNNVAHSIRPSLDGAGNSESILSNLNPVKFKLTNSTWNMMAGIMGILRGIVKHLKGEDNEFARVLWNSLSASLSKVPWDVLNGIHENRSSKHGSCYGEDALLLMAAGDTEVKILFLGNLVQLFCSLVKQSSLVEAGAGIHNEFAFLHETCEFVPKLLHWCLTGEWSYRFGHILPYFQHKTLMLMTRLSFRVQLDYSTLVQWLELLHKYYQDLLTRPISQLKDGEDDILEGSPFLLSFYDQEVHPLSLWHLQRQAVFLFLRCCLSMIGLRKLSADSNGGCMNPNSHCASELISTRDGCTSTKKKELLDLFRWLQSHVPSIMLSDDELYLEKRIGFASSFIKLYIHEDDMLFEVLLQMFTISSWAERRFLMEGTCQDAEEDILFHISNFFNPLLLFHIFLAELQYDHHLLLDYLISKDSGSKFAEYLLRCLRIVCDSWPLFLEFSVKEQVVCRKSCKKRRTSSEYSYGEQSTIPLRTEVALSSEQNPEDLELKGKFPENGNIQLEDAKACLLSLKSSLQKLHRRKLFPYNPEVLIRRYVHASKDNGIVYTIFFC